MRVVFEWDKGVPLPQDQAIRAEHGLNGKDEIRQTLTPIILGGRLKEFRKEQKCLTDVAIVTTCYVLKPSAKVEAASKCGAEEASRLLEGYEFGLEGNYLRVRTTRDREKVQKARLAPRTWFKELNNCADHRKWENGYYACPSWARFNPWKPGMVSLEDKEEDKGEIQAGVPLFPPFIVKFWYPELCLKEIRKLLGFKEVYCIHDFERWCGNLQLPKPKGCQYWENGQLPPWKNCCKVPLWNDARRLPDESFGVRTFTLSDGSKLQVGGALDDEAANSAPIEREYYYDPVRDAVYAKHANEVVTHRADLPSSSHPPALAADTGSRQRS